MVNLAHDRELARRLLKRAASFLARLVAWGWFREEAMPLGPDDTGSPKNACEVENGTAQVRTFLGFPRGKEGALAVAQTRWENRRSPNPLPVMESIAIRRVEAHASLQYQAGHGFVARTRHDPPALFQYSRIEHSLQD